MFKCIIKHVNKVLQFLLQQTLQENQHPSPPLANRPQQCQRLIQQTPTTTKLNLGKLYLDQHSMCQSKFWYCVFLYKFLWGQLCSYYVVNRAWGCNIPSVYAAMSCKAIHGTVTNNQFNCRKLEYFKTIM